ncbi:MAG: hypothetical protein A3G93_13670 [Nitrospinae bacterium RIFCSPLOWO2_12_FULL_45_22]|nr:MAG: hypothetical protein A3G93_13670 [Nitrospinae bacterium RIFCSPLOWO2_12_FULL_45_22]
MLETQRLISEAEWSFFEKEIENRMSARSLAQDKAKMGNGWSMALAALHRPLGSLTCLTLFASSLLAPSFGLPHFSFSQAHKDRMMTLIILYFGRRSTGYVAQWRLAKIFL